MFDEPVRAVVMFGIGFILGWLLPKLYRKAKNWFDRKMFWF